MKFVALSQTTNFYKLFWTKWPVSQCFYIPLPIYVPKNLRVMTTSNPHRHTKKRLFKTVGAHTPCSCGYIQDGELYFYIKDYQGNVRVVLNQVNFVSEADAEKIAKEEEKRAFEERKKRKAKQ